VYLLHMANWPRVINIRGYGARAALEDRRSNEFPESYPMHGGQGAYSYAQNSKYQVPFFC
jgi:hypothetical protein